MWMPEIAKAEDAGEHFAWHSWHCSGIDRKIIAKGMGYFSPMRYSELPRFYREHLDPVDVVMLQVTPMDKHGNFNFGLACSHLADMLARAKCVIVEVNQNLPWVYGLTGTEINIQDVTYVVEGDNPPIAQLGAGGPATEVLRRTEGLLSHACDILQKLLLHLLVQMEGLDFGAVSCSFLPVSYTHLSAQRPC